MVEGNEGFKMSGQGHSNIYHLFFELNDVKDNILGYGLRRLGNYGAIIEICICFATRTVYWFLKLNNFLTETKDIPRAFWS